MVSSSATLPTRAGKKRSHEGGGGGSRGFPSDGTTIHATHVVCEPPARTRILTSSPPNRPPAWVAGHSTTLLPCRRRVSPARKRGYSPPKRPKYKYKRACMGAVDVRSVGGRGWAHREVGERGKGREVLFCLIRSADLWPAGLLARGTRQLYLQVVCQAHPLCRRPHGNRSGKREMKTIRTKDEQEAFCGSCESAKAAMGG